MDSLIKYIESRRKRYGHIKGEQAISSIYYTIGDKIVRISDHLKYGSQTVKQVDYNFVMQPDDTYIFSVSPKLVEDGKMYLKIIDLDTAKKFIRKLHDCAITVDELSSVFRPLDWKTNDGSRIDKPSWDDFCKEHLNPEPDVIKQNILDKLELVYHGALRKGKLQEKLDRCPEVYENLTITQYETFMKKIGKDF